MKLWNRIGDAMLERLVPAGKARGACISCTQPGQCSSATIESRCDAGRYSERCCLAGGACGSYSCGSWTYCGMNC